MLLGIVWFGVASAGGHVPVPDSVLHPRSPAEAWNVLRLATDNVARLLAENRLAEVPDQASLCSPALRVLKVADVPPDRRGLVATEAVQSLVAVTSLAQAGLSGDKGTAEQMLAALRDHLRALAAGFDEKIVKSDIFYCPMHPDFVSTDAGAHCARCGMGLLPRRIPYSFVYVPAGEPSLRLSAALAEKLTPGRASQVRVRLARRDGSPVLPEDLLVMHTQPIHLLIVDPGLGDYHHEHPVATDVPGEYAFTYTPATKSGYRIFADVVPADTGVQEYSWTDLPGEEGSPRRVAVQEADSLSSVQDGYRFRLSVADGSGGPPRARQVCALRVSIEEAATGKPVTALGPVMGAFAHLVGFYGDGCTVVHLHPLGPEEVDANARGGPTLEFRFYPPKEGFIRLYCQVEIGGRAIYCPFNINVVP